jgi:hypothetical protein
MAEYQAPERPLKLKSCPLSPRMSGLPLPPLVTTGAGVAGATGAEAGGRRGWRWSWCTRRCRTIGEVDSWEDTTMLCILCVCNIADEGSFVQDDCLYHAISLRVQGGSSKSWDTRTPIGSWFECEIIDH